MLRTPAGVSRSSGPPVGLGSGQAEQPTGRQASDGRRSSRRSRSEHTHATGLPSSNARHRSSSSRTRPQSSGNPFSNAAPVTAEPVSQTNNPFLSAIEEDQEKTDTESMLSSLHRRRDSYCSVHSTSSNSTTRNGDDDGYSSSDDHSHHHHRQERSIRYKPFVAPKRIKIPKITPHAPHRPTENMGSQGQQMQDKLQEMQTVAALRSALNQFRIKLTEMLIATLRSIGHLISRSSGH